MTGIKKYFKDIRAYFLIAGMALGMFVYGKCGREVKLLYSYEIGLDDFLHACFYSLALNIRFCLTVLVVSCFKWRTKAACVLLFLTAFVFSGMAIMLVIFQMKIAIFEMPVLFSKTVAILLICNPKNIASYKIAGIISLVLGVLFGNFLLFYF